MNRFRYAFLCTTPLLVSLLFVAVAGASLSAQDIGGNNAGPSGTPLKPTALYQKPSARERFHRYVLDAYGPTALFAAGITAATDQPENAPPEWKQGAAGFGRRFGSRFGQFAVAETARYGLAAMLDEDTRYHPCECGGALPRLGHALLSSVTARSADGHRVISIPDLVAPYAGGLVATSAWYPARFGPKDGIRLGTWAFGIHTGVNIVREFLPHRH
jgi:hypothetical protein